MPTKGKKSNRKSTKSNTKPLAIAVLGVVGAVTVAVFLSRGAPEQPATDLGSPGRSSTASALHVQGPENPLVTLVEYGDYQCPTCQVFHPVVSELLRLFPEELQLEFHHYPLVSVHRNAIFAAIAAEAAGEQDSFWEMHDLLFVYQATWATHPSPQTVFVSFAQRLGLDTDLFEDDLRSDEVEARVLADVTRAREMRLDGVPTFFVNGQRIAIPRSLEEFEDVILAAVEEGRSG